MTDQRAIYVVIFEASPIGSQRTHSLNCGDGENARSAPLDSPTRPSSPWAGSESRQMSRLRPFVRRTWNSSFCPAVTFGRVVTIRALRLNAHHHTVGR